MTDIKEFYIDKFLPAVLNLTAAGDGGDVTPEKLRYIAHEILLFLGDELPERWIPVSERLPNKWYSDIGDEFIVFKPGFTDMKFPVKWDNDAKEFFTGGYGNPVTYWKGITHWRPLPAAPEVT